MMGVVVKVGGSLFDLADLGPRLTTWLKQLDDPVLLVPGGGASVDVIRALDRTHGLGEENSHWLALHALSVNARLLATLVPGAEVIADVQTWPRMHATAVLDPFPFAAWDETNPDHLPHSWSVTSDSLALRVAQVAKAESLILLKSVPVPSAMTWTEASQAGLVDGYFPTLARAASAEIRTVCLRRDPG